MSLNDTILCMNLEYKVSKYFIDEQNQDKNSIADFIYSRFKERYIDSVMETDKIYKNGFAIMAVSCLMIEALETFYQGWKNSNNRSHRCFLSFFSHCSQLKDFKDYDNDFYKNIRCGIIHQAETVNGWKIRRDGNLLNPKTKTINANKFIKELEAYLQEYCDKLKISDWNDQIWINFRVKMKTIIKNCQTTE